MGLPLRRGRRKGNILIVASMFLGSAGTCIPMGISCREGRTYNQKSDHMDRGVPMRELVQGIKMHHVPLV